MFKKRFNWVRYFVGGKKSCFFLMERVLKIKLVILILIYGIFLERIVENLMILINVWEYNNVDDDFVMRDIEYDIDVKVMKLSEVIDVRSDNFFEINIRCENWVMVFSVEEDDDYNLVEI